MAVTALTNSFAYVDSHDFSGDSNRFMLTCAAAQNQKTTFRSDGWHEFNNGLKTSQLELGGYVQFGTDTVDEYAFNALGVTGRVTTAGAVETEGSPCGMLQAMQHQYQLLGPVGENAPFSLQGGCSDGVGVVRGFLAKEQAAVSSTGATGTGMQLGAVSATQYLYATFHLMGTAGTTITAVVESDDNSGFSSATTRITFGPYTTVGGRWGTRVAGAITDDYYRLRVTAITGTWTVACAIGIQ